MKYKEFIPGDALKPYVKCYYLYESGTAAVVEDKAFATGCIEIMFNLGTGSWQTASGSDFKTTPPMELWGQIIQPLAFRSMGKNCMLGIRFYPHTASIFLHPGISLFNNQVTDLAEVAGKPASILHARLLESESLAGRLALIEAFLLDRLSHVEKKRKNFPLINSVVKELNRVEASDQIGALASRHGISSRYLQKIFVEYTGLTPKLYSKINRFRKSLQLVGNNNTSLTSIAYECGYFDQSHFIREFKSFTGLAPSAFNPAGSSAILISPA